MDDVIEYVREWNLESSKNGLERYIEEKQQETAEASFKAGEAKNSLDIAKNLLNLEISVDKIMKATGLSRKQVLSLK